MGGRGRGWSGLKVEGRGVEGGGGEVEYSPASSSSSEGVLICASSRLRRTFPTARRQRRIREFRLSMLVINRVRGGGGCPGGGRG